MRITEEIELKPITIILDTQKEIDQLHTLLNQIQVNVVLETHDEEWSKLHKLLSRRISHEAEKLFTKFNNLIK